MLTIAVLTFRNWKHLLPDCLASIQPPEGVGTELLVVDNCAPIPVEVDPPWHVIRTEKNIGGIAGQNYCFRMAKYDWVLFVSDDVRFKQEAISELWYQRTVDKQVSPVIFWPNQETQALGGRIDFGCVGKNNLRQDRIDYIPSITYLMHKTLWIKAGCFDESLPGAYEDVDMGLKLGKDRLRVCIDSEAIHLGNATLKYTFRDKWRFLSARTRILSRVILGRYTSRGVLRNSLATDSLQ